MGSFCNFLKLCLLLRVFFSFIVFLGFFFTNSRKGKHLFVNSLSIMCPSTLNKKTIICTSSKIGNSYYIFSLNSLLMILFTNNNNPSIYFHQPYMHNLLLSSRYEPNFFTFPRLLNKTFAQFCHILYFCLFNNKIIDRAWTLGHRVSCYFFKMYM